MAPFSLLTLIFVPIDLVTSYTMIEYTICVDDCSVISPGTFICRAPDKHTTTLFGTLLLEFQTGARQTVF